MSSEAKNVGVELDRASDVRHLIANTPQARDERLSVGRPALLTGLLRCVHGLPRGRSTVIVGWKPPAAPGRRSRHLICPDGIKPTRHPCYASRDTLPNRLHWHFDVHTRHSWAYAECAGQNRVGGTRPKMNRDASHFRARRRIQRWLFPHQSPAVGPRGPHGKRRGRCDSGTAPETPRLLRAA
jgi:hypothetical protein